MESGILTRRSATRITRTASKRKTSFKLTLSILFFTLIPAAQAVGSLAPFTVSYDVDYSVASGVMTLTLSEGDSGAYSMDSVTEAKGAARIFFQNPVSEHATFEITETGIKATGYQLDDGSSSSRKDMRIDYDWDSSEAALQSEDGPETRPIEEGTMDQLVMQAAAIMEVKSGKRQFSFRQLKPGRKISPYVYEYLGEEVLPTEIGELKTVKYSRTREGDSKTTHFWYAVDHDYTPVQLQRIKKQKTVFTATLISLDR